MKKTKEFNSLADAFHTADSKVTAQPNRSMTSSYAPPVEGFMPHKPQTPAQHASVKKAAAASVAKRRGQMPLTFKPTKGAF